MSHVYGRREGWTRLPMGGIVSLTDTPPPFINHPGNDDSVRTTTPKTQDLLLLSIYLLI